MNAFFPFNAGNCHAFVRCVTDPKNQQKKIGCPYPCEPYSLEYNPQLDVCEFDVPGACSDTPSSPATAYTTLKPFATPPKTTAGPTRPDTTPQRTTPERTTPQKTTTAEKTTPQKTTTAEKTTPQKTTTPAATRPTLPPGIECFYDGQKLEYPGNCHYYLLCFESPAGSGQFYADCYSCGELIYKPDTHSCGWPDTADDLLCGDPIPGLPACEV